MSTIGKKNAKFMACVGRQSVLQPFQKRFAGRKHWTEIKQIKNCVLFTYGEFSNLIHCGNSGKVVFGNIQSVHGHDDAGEKLHLDAIPTELSALQRWQRGVVDGRYTAIVPSPETESVHIICDPSGAETIYFCEVEGAIIIANSLDLILSEGIVPFQINDDYFCAYILHGNRSFNSFPICGIRELQSTECLTINWFGTGTLSSIFCNVIDFANISEGESGDDDIWELLVKTATGLCISFESIGVSLSGGLDSSVILASLSKANENYNRSIKPVTFYHPKVASGDERDLAARSAKHHGLALTSVNVEDCLPFSEILKVDCCEFDKPTPQLITLSLHKALLAAAETPEVFVNGFGGDHVFFADSETPLLAAEYFWQMKLRKGLLECMRSAAQTNNTLWATLAHAVTFLCKGNSLETWLTQPLETGWFDKSLVEHGKRISKLPLWWKSATRLSPLKKSQMLDIYDCFGQQDKRIHNNITTISPLIKWPIIELALRQPTDNLLKGEIDRVALRRAASGYVVPEIINRRSKGEHSAFFHYGFARQMDVIVDLLRHGWMVKRGYIHFETLEEALGQAASGFTKDLWPIVNFVSAELWIRGWSARYS